MIGIDRKGNIWQVSDTVSLCHAYERLEKTNFSFIFGALKTYPIFLLNALFSSDAGSTWNTIIFDYDCPFQQNWQYIAGITRKGQTLYSNDKGNSWVFYEEPRSNKYFQYKWIIAIPKFFTVNNSLTSLDYGRTWINTSTIKTAFLTSFIGNFWAQITRAEVKEVNQSELPLPEDLYNLMLEYLPKYERSSRFFQGVISTHAREIYKVLNLLKDIQKQFFVSTADWGLDIWEEMLGLSKEGSLSDEERRRRILAKLQSVQGINLYNLERVLSQLTGKTLKVVEDFEKNAILIKGFNEIPSNPLYLYTYIRDFIPAHLGIVFEYRLWDWLDSREWTWDYFDSLNLTWDKYEEIDEEVDKVA